MEIHMQTNIADKALRITPLHTTRQVLGQGNRHPTNWRYILEILAITDTYHCAHFVFVQYLIDLIARSFTTRLRNTPSAMFYRNRYGTQMSARRLSVFTVFPLFRVQRRSWCFIQRPATLQTWITRGTLDTGGFAS